MVDLSSVVPFFWRPGVVWKVGTFDFRTAAILFGISFAFAFVFDLVLGREGFRMYSLVALPAVIIGWIFAFPAYIGLAGVEAAGGMELLRAFGSAVTANLSSLVIFLILWIGFELVVLRGLMALISFIFHHPLEAHVDAWVVGPVIEEYAFRWVLMGLLIGWGIPIEIAILVQGVLFALIHIKDGLLRGSSAWVGIVSANITVPLGFALGFIAITYGLLYAILFHIFFNFVFDIINIALGGGE